MAYIEKMILEGFKSFRNKTVIKFDKGFTGIVGANGSGKSNIIDAFLFVLGTLSTKDLRANKSADLISNGGQGHPPAKSASVTLVIDNKDKAVPLSYEKITITRIINRDGKGVYKVNGKRSTRKDILNLLEISGLSPNSSNMIMQGKLFELINMNEVQRRELIEDLAGIAAYNEKKAKAEEELLKIQENLGQISLLMNEVYVQLEDLEKEKRDAEKYLELSEQEKILKNALALLHIDKNKEIIGNLEKENSKLEEKIRQYIEKKNSNLKLLSELNSRLEILKEKIKEMQSGEFQELIKEKKELSEKITELKTSLKFMQKNLEDLIERESFIDNKITDLTGKKTELENSLKIVSEEKAKLDLRKKRLLNEIDEIETQIGKNDEDFQKLSEKKKILETDLAKLSEKLSASTVRKNVLVSKLENLEKNREKLINDIGKHKKKIDELKRKIAEIKKRRAELLGISESEEFSQEKLDKKISGLNKKIEELRNRDSQIKQHINKLQSKIMELKSELAVQNRLSQNDRAIKELYRLKHEGRIAGIYGTIADLGRADPKYNTALEMAVGNRFNYFVVDSAKTAEICIRYLKEKKLGRASFIPLDSIRVSPFNYNFPNNSDIIGRAVDLIEFDPLFSKAFEYIFGRIIIVRDITAARKLNIPATRVTLDGDVVNSSNLMTGGIKQKSKGFGFKSINKEELEMLEIEYNGSIRILKENEEKIERLQREISRIYHVKLSGANKTKHFDNEIAGYQSRIEQLKELIEEKKKEINKLGMEEQTIQNELVHVERDIEEYTQNKSKILERLNNIRQEMESSEQSILKQRLTELRNELRSLEKEISELEIKSTQISTKLSEKIIAALNEYLSEIDEIRDKINNTRGSLNKLKDDLMRYTEKLEEVNKEINVKNSELSGLFEDERELKLKIAKISSENRVIDSKINPLRLEISKNSFKIDELNVRINEWKCKLNPDIKVNDDILAKEIREIESRLIQIKGEMESLGEINMKAIEKYNECHSRFVQLEEKNSVIIKEREALLEFIDHLESEKKEVFLKTFDSINKNFAYIFKKLSPDGEAKLELENPDDPFSGGINILARPGKKKWCLTQAMSGGEKTLTIIALILGIQMHVPSPYYILDEIDAALDDSNAALVADMIKELSKKSQFIIITHRDVTMARVDQLLGVSNRNGISSVVNLSIKDVVAKIKSNGPNENNLSIKAG